MNPLECASSDGHLFVCSFDQLYKKDSRVAIVMFLSSFIACYSRMHVADRMSTLEWLKELMADVGTENFEDGSDFVDFMKEKFAEKRGDE